MILSRFKNFCRFNIKIFTYISLNLFYFFKQQEVSPRTSGRLSHSSGPLNGSLSDSPPVSPSEMDDLKVFALF